MALTPMLKQYLSIKKAHPDSFLFFRLGDFYEMFFDDATKGAEILDITLTARGKHNDAPIPMCGVPFHSAQNYINRLTQEGHTVAICEQVEEPGAAKGIVKRDVVRIITPGTNIEDDSLPAGTNTFIAAVYKTKKRFGIAYLDLATGDFNVSEYATEHEAINLLSLIEPKELLLPDALRTTPSIALFIDRTPKMLCKIYEAWIFEQEHAEHLLKETFSLFSLQGLGLSAYTGGISAAGAILYYLRENLYESLGHLKQPKPIDRHSHVAMDRNTIEHLGIFPTGDKATRGHSLFETINHTKTAMGQRLLAQWLQRPLITKSTIDERLSIVERLYESLQTTQQLQDAFRTIRDIEKIIGRLSCGVSNPRDFVSLRESLAVLPMVKEIMHATAHPSIEALAKNIELFDTLRDTLFAAIIDNPPALIRAGGYIKRGYHAELDELVTISKNARSVIADLQAQEAERTGIKSLKIKFNKVFGFYIEITKSNLAQVPEEYERKQTLVNAERFTIPILKEYEQKILHADEKSCIIEEQLFEDLRALVLNEKSALQRTATAIATTDVLTGFAVIARENHYTRPEVHDEYNIVISGGRHPVVERTLQDATFVENDCSFSAGSEELLLITGPNMAGKSTFLRQTALITILAQIGSFVPAERAHIGITDKIFTRIGASDNLTVGESTFMVEMIETANILNNATGRSLVIMDEVGRGTSTFDGVSIAWAICEFFAEQQQTPKVLFATHYHELSQLDQYSPTIKNYNATVKDDADGIVFLRKIKKGAADKSYGIHVAQLAGLPATVITRAEEVLSFIEKDKIDKEELAEAVHQEKRTKTVHTTKTDISSLPLFQSAQDDHPAVKKLRECDILSLTPLDALNILNELKNCVDNSTIQQ